MKFLRSFNQADSQVLLLETCAGLFRHPTQSRKVGGKRGRRLGYIHKLELGTLEDLRTASKGGLDPDGARIAAGTCSGKG